MGFRKLSATGNARWEGRLAVISPYAQQVRLLRRSLKTLLGVHETKACPIDVNTVDGFQVGLFCGIPVLDAMYSVRYRSVLIALNHLNYFRVAHMCMWA